MLQGNVPGNARLGIPALNLNDGPQGFRGNPGTSTCWPSGLTVAASWNRTALGAWGVAMGQVRDCRAFHSARRLTTPCVLFLHAGVCGQG